jgi:uncharacterized protein
MRPAQQILTLMLKFYRYWLSPWLGTACRFEPTCSVYTLQAVQTHGAAAGTYLGLRRLLRCHPWCAGGVDPIPAPRPELLAGWGGPTQTTSPTTLEIGKKHHE